LRWRAWLRTAPGWERISLRWLQAFSGVIVIEATKQLYGAVPNRVIHRRSRITLPLPAQPLPTARHLRSSEDRGG
jgi:hypothetical protein